MTSFPPLRYQSRLCSCSGGTSAIHKSRATDRKDGRSCDLVPRGGCFLNFWKYHSPNVGGRDCPPTTRKIRCYRHFLSPALPQNSGAHPLGVSTDKSRMSHPRARFFARGLILFLSHFTLYIFDFFIIYPLIVKINMFSRGNTPSQAPFIAKQQV